MAYLVVVVSVPDETINQIAQNVNRGGVKNSEIEVARTYLEAMASRCKRSDNAYIVVRDTDPAVSTSGTNSISLDVSKP